MRTLLLIWLLAFVAVFPLVANAANGAPARPAEVFAEMAPNFSYAAGFQASQSQCQCLKWGVCGQQQPAGLDGWTSCFFERPLKTVARPPVRTLVLSSHIPELDPPPPRKRPC